MTITNDWRKDVARFIREADLADIKRFDDVAAYYAPAQKEVVQKIIACRMYGTPVGYEEVFGICIDALGAFTSNYQKMRDLAISICSRLAIDY